MKDWKFPNLCKRWQNHQQDLQGQQKTVIVLFWFLLASGRNQCLNAGYVARRRKTTTFSSCPSSHPSPAEQPHLPTSCSSLPMLPLFSFFHVNQDLAHYPTSTVALAGTLQPSKQLKTSPCVRTPTLPWGYIGHKESKPPGIAQLWLLFAVHNQLCNPPFVDSKMLILPNCTALLYPYCRLKIKACLT